MGGKGSGASRKRKALPVRPRPGWLSRTDQRLRFVKQLKASMAGVASDLGGMDALSTLERMLLERLAHADALASQIEEKARANVAIDVTQYCALVDRVVRIGQVLGTQRRTRALPSALEYADRIAAHSSQEAGQS